MDEGQGSEKLSALRESLRRLDAVLNFARKLVRESGDVPPGLMTDFFEARKEVEKAFVVAFEEVEDKLQKQLRELLLATKSLTSKQVAAHTDKLSQRVRSALNQLVIHGDGGPSLTLELGEVRFHDDDPMHEPAATPSAAFVFPAPQPQLQAARPAAQKGRPMRRALAAVVLIGVMGGLAVLAAVLLWPKPTALPHNTIGKDNTPPPRNRPPDNTPPEEDTTPFDAAANGYTVRLAVVSLDVDANPLHANPATMTPDEIAVMLLGYEDLIHLLEPERLAFPPEQSRARIQRFAETAVAAQDGWIEQRTPLIDAYIAHIRKEQQLALYPPETSANKLLVSDVLYSGGGGQFALVVTLQVLGRGCGAPLRLIAPTGISRPLLAVETPEGVSTFNGESFGLRSGRQQVALLPEILVEMSLKLRPTMDTAAGRILCSAVVLQQRGSIDWQQAAEALADLDLAWLAPPPEDDPRAALLHELAVRLQPIVCAALLAPGVQGTSDEALALYRLAVAAGDAEHADKALLALGERASKGAMLDGEPLPLVVGDLLLAQNRSADADKWYYRAMDEHPADTRPVLRLLQRASSATRLTLCREGYMRGERSQAFMRTFAKAAAEADDNLLALKLLDELLSGGNFDPQDLHDAVLQCMAIGRVDWALERLAGNSDIVAGEPALLRLDLICELSAHGLSDRAKDLAARWRLRGESDEFIEGLLRRFGA